MGSASDTFADITRDQYNDWLTKYYPKLQETMDYATNGQLMNDQLARANTNTQQSLNTATVGQANQLARYGQSSTANPQDNSTGLSSALATAQSDNNIRTAQQDRSLNMLTGATGSLSDLMNTKTSSS